jgi:hypothetical protein
MATGPARHRQNICNNRHNDNEPIDTQRHAKTDE